MSDVDILPPLAADIPDDWGMDFTALSDDTRRRTLRISVTALALIAKGNGATDATLKALILHLRSADVAILRDAEAADILDHLRLSNA